MKAVVVGGETRIGSEDGQAGGREHGHKRTKRSESLNEREGDLRGRSVGMRRNELDGTGVTALAVTPGWIRSENMLDHFGVTEDTWRDALAATPDFAISESPTFVARGIAALAADSNAARFAGEVLTSHGLALEYGHTDVDGSRPDCWGHIAAGRPEPIDHWR